ncbi:hypothetical protein ACIBRY_36785 [Streptomyces anulatus]
MKVTITGTGDLDPDWKFWHHGGDELVLTVGEAATTKARADLGALATVQGSPSEAALADELRLAIAPLLVGRPDVVRMLGPAGYPGGHTCRLRLREARQICDSSDL